MKKGKLFIVSGPSGSGKTTLYQKIMQLNKYKDKIVRTVSVTTREKRKGEIQGKDYFFVSKKMFVFKQKAGHFLESMNVFDNFYGTPKKIVRDLIRRGKNPLLCIDVKGAEVVKKQFPSAVTIFINTPSFAVLKDRLISRGSDSHSVIALRLKTAKTEIQEARKYKYIVINDVCAKAVREMDKIISTELGTM
jgi:guanylate kinase